MIIVLSLTHVFCVFLFFQFVLICFFMSRSNNDIYLSLCSHLSSYTLLSRSSSVSLSLKKGYFSCHALIGTWTYRCLSSKNQHHGFSLYLCHGTLTVLLRYRYLIITVLDDVWSRQHIFAKNLDSFQGFCFYCFLLSSIFIL